jgi:hypothetical protein
VVIASAWVEDTPGLNHAGVSFFGKYGNAVMQIDQMCIVCAIWTVKYLKALATQKKNNNKLKKIHWQTPYVVDQRFIFYYTWHNLPFSMSCNDLPNHRANGSSCLIKINDCNYIFFALKKHLFFLLFFKRRRDSRVEWALSGTHQEEADYFIFHSHDKNVNKPENPK